MKSIIARSMCVLALSLAATGTFAQESSNRVAANTDWSVFEDDQCWAVSTPKESTITQNGRLVAANRGDILLLVSYWKDQPGTGEVSFVGGYPFANGSIVTLTVGSSSFDMFTSGETAWSAGPAEDAKIIAAMKRGAKAILVGKSSRGKRTEDSFSLLGFTAAVDDAGKRCN